MYQDTKKACQKTDFVSKLKEIQIYHKKSNGHLVYNYKLDVLKEIAAQQNWMTELDEYNDKDEDDDEDETPQNPSQKAMTVDEYNKYEEGKIINEKLQNENKEVYKKLLKSNEQITNLVNIVMDKFNIENITMELEDHKSQINETNIKKSNEIKKHNKRIDEFVDSIELF